MLGRYQPHEIGSGWVQPGLLGRQLRSGMRWMSGRESSRDSWVGAITLSLVILSWWHGKPVLEIVAWVISCASRLLV